MLKAFRHAALALGLIGLSLAAHAEPILEIAPDDQTVELFDQVSVDIIITPGEFLIGAFDILITFDDSILDLADVVFGVALGDGPLQLDVDFGDAVQLAEISLVFNLNTLAALQAADSFVLATLVFDAIGEGESLLDILPNIPPDFLAFVGDERGARILSAEAIGGRIVVNARPVVSVPEPATWLMMLAGLAGIFAARRRRIPLTK